MWELAVHLLERKIVTRYYIASTELPSLPFRSEVGSPTYLSVHGVLWPLQDPDALFNIGIWKWRRIWWLSGIKVI